jgi:hypothetical protein
MWIKRAFFGTDKNSSYSHKELYKQDLKNGNYENRKINEK